MEGDALTLYDDLWNAAHRLSLAAPVPVPASLTVGEVETVISYFLDDNPRFYWADPLPGEDDQGARSIWLNPGYDAGEIQSREQELLAAADRLLEGLVTDEAEIAYILHDRLIDSLVYEREGAHPDVANLYGGLVRGSVICDGFARTYQFLLDRAGVEAVTLRGSSHRGISHAWNAVRIDGDWYYVDLTWNKAASEESAASHQYLCISFDEMIGQHQWLAGQYPQLPATGSRDACYFVRGGWAVRGEDTGSREELSAAFAARLAAMAPDAAPGEEVYLEIKLLCGQEDYRQLKSLFIKSLYEILADLDREAAANGRPYSVQTTGEIRCDYNDAVQVLILYPRIG